MALDLDEQEQLAKLKNFWKDNAKYFIALIVILAIVYSGWRFYNSYQNKQAINSAKVLFQLTQALEQKQAAAIKTLSSELKTNYANTVKAQEAALYVAKYAYVNNDLATAKEELNWLEKQNFNPIYQTAAQFRLANIAYQEKDYPQALAWLDKIATQEQALIYAFRGDILLAQGDKEKAIEQYKLALPNADEIGNLVQLKLNRLGVDTTKL